MSDSRNSKRSRSSKPKTARQAFPAGVILLLCALSAAAVWWFHSKGYTLYFGDAQAHLSIARRILDSRSPGYEQIGTVWLPLPHVLMLPLVRHESLWRSGLAGAIPAAVFFVLGGVFLYFAARRISACPATATAAVALFALNPNMLYVQSVPMTETIFFGALLGTLYFTLAGSRLGAAFFCLLAVLTRYEGWFLIPFAAAYLFDRKRIAAWVLFVVITCAGPVYWLAHNQWYYSNPLEFYSGPYSAKAIYQRAIDQGLERYPGDHDLPRAVRQYRAAAELCAGLPLLVMALPGAVAALFRRAWWPLVLLLLPSIFYVASIYSSGTPIFVPNLWPNSYYNTRYALAVIPFAALAAAMLVTLAPQSWRRAAAVVVVLAAVAPWLLYPRMEGWVCWKESQVNSQARRAWTSEAAQYLKQNYRTGEGVLASFGDLTGIFREAGIPLRQTLHEGNNPLWQASLNRPDLFLWQKWAVAMGGDAVANVLAKTGLRGPSYRCVKVVEVKGAPLIQIFERELP